LGIGRRPTPPARWWDRSSAAGALAAWRPDRRPSVVAAMDESAVRARRANVPGAFAKPPGPQRSRHTAARAKPQACFSSPIRPSFGTDLLFGPGGEPDGDGIGAGACAPLGHPLLPLAVLAHLHRQALVSGIARICAPIVVFAGGERAHGPRAHWRQPD